LVDKKGEEKDIRPSANKKNKRNGETSWVVKILICTFLISVVISLISENLISELNTFFSLLVLLLVIMLNVLFDTLGMAVVSADPTVFHAMASRKLPGAKKALWLIQNSEKVANFCNDVVGDIAGVISGTAAAAILMGILQEAGIQKGMLWYSALFTAVISSVTVGGKAAGKFLGVRKANAMLLTVAKILEFFSFSKKSR